MPDFSDSTPGNNEPLIHWVDTAGVPQAPVPRTTLLGWIDAGHLPVDTPAWWEGLDGWTTAAQLRVSPALQDAPAMPPLPTDNAATEVAPTDQPAASTPQLSEPQVNTPQVTEPQADAPQPDAPQVADLPVAAASPEITDAFDDQELDDAFMDLVSRSSDLYKESERATSMDEVFLGGVIAAFGANGFLLIDIFTGGSLRSSGSASAAPQVSTPINRHELRFEHPPSGARVALIVDHLTPDVGSAKVLGQRARLQLGYGERIPNFGQVGRALRQEMASTFVVSPEPGRVTFDADLSSGFVYCQTDLLWELDRYVDDSMDVDAELLHKHLAAIVHTMRKFLRLRFAG
ncbi:hypothetical protein [Candidatus Neomicrothrix sp.]|uniref:hypothetical protein n=1 Tax=Candidatus Neomicrothrix sp. TaxID=2719034 RepID=UPI001B77C4FD|nr:hypothetical protein [Candidatus Microthrix sp.]MBP7877901.1 hypothetical protein [Candidatus Microthrix sp.]MBP8957151.1 hypothetical protein [Candidatus Microthrix sp.]MBP9621879.1 hypothetical protein [Candidatus Microthrix sp.]